MSLANRSVVTIDDLSNKEIEALFSLAGKMSDSLDDQSGVCQGKIMASMFFEPSTRTRLSFETAMLRLGGKVITAVEVGATSLAKGESLADMARVVGSYADIIVIRHPWEGAARVVADYAGIPVINAGDGGHEHPTQALCDLYTIKKERRSIKGLKIALWGDLKHGRTIHSLTYALARFGATILFRSGPGLEIPEHVLNKLTTEYGGELKKDELLRQTVKDNILPIDAIYVAPDNPHQPALMPHVNVELEIMSRIDALYGTRLQMERLSSGDKEQGLKGSYPVLNKKLLKEKEFKKALVMHPLPRVDELAYELDADPRSMYFKQAAYGVPVRMALVALLLGTRELAISQKTGSFIKKADYPIYDRDFGVRCSNSNCASNQETEIRYIKPEFKIVSSAPLTLRCLYCERELQPRYIASSEWHQGMVETKRYHDADSHLARKIKPENLIIFDSESEAKARGFKPSRYVR